ncbi:MAG: hypothetical protein HZC17_01790 [Candidatus Omnitrophica bacterium]|nr:hypothetical protein [Candidatus Omnitrophota bacterium]
MTPAEIAAYVGAAAWLPPIFYVIYKATIKPKIELVPGSIPEVGYTTYGPIFNINCALSTSRSDAVIRNIRVVLEHEKGTKITLTWAFLNETFSEITSMSGERAEISKRQPAIALKVGTVALVEKLIGFQDFEFQRKRNDLYKNLIEFYNHVKKIHPLAFQNETLESREFASVVEFFKKEFFWKQGIYTARIDIFLVGKKKPATQSFSFPLSDSEIERLNENLSEIERVIKDATAPPPENKKQELYNWVNPALSLTKNA